MTITKEQAIEILAGKVNRIREERERLLARATKGGLVELVENSERAVRAELEGSIYSELLKKAEEWTEKQFQDALSMTTTRLRERLFEFETPRSTCPFHNAVYNCTPQAYRRAIFQLEGVLLAMQDDQ